MPGRALEVTPAQIGLVLEDVNLNTESNHRHADFQSEYFLYNILIYMIIEFDNFN